MARCQDGKMAMWQGGKMARCSGPKTWVAGSFARSESFCAYAKILLMYRYKLKVVWTAFYMFDNFPDGFKTARIFPDGLKTFQKVSKLSGSFRMT